MHCPTCYAELLPDLAFCLWCGSGLEEVDPAYTRRPLSVSYLRCRVCSKLVTASARFCTGCGAALSDGPKEPSSPTSNDERRTVTVLQGDLVAFSHLVEALSPEEIKGVLDTVYTLLTREIVAQGGTVDTFIGDAVVALFGVPHAHGDDPRRAVDAALAIHKALEKVAQRLQQERGLTLAMRIGIATGSAVIGAVAGGRRITATGAVLAAAMELEAAAPPGGTLVGDATWGQLGERFRGRRYSDRPLSREAWVVLGRAPAAEARAAPLLQPPFVGRELELSQLAALYERAVADRRVVTVNLVGPAGIGKSRLIRELVELASRPEASAPPLAFSGTSAPLGRQGSVDVLVQWLRAMAGGTPTDPGPEDLAQLVKGALFAPGEGAFPADEAAELIAHFMGIPPRQPAFLPELVRDPARLRRRTAAAVGALFGALARQAPLILISEDHHHCRPSAAALIDEALGRAGEAPVLLLRALREPEALADPSFLPSGPRGVETHEIRLAPLSRPAILAMIFDAAHTAPGDGEAQLGALVDAADGNPRFALELARHTQDRGAPQAQRVDTLHSLMQARLDRLPDEQRRVLRAASVVGLSFWDELLARLGLPNPHPALDGLLTTGLIRRRRLSAIEGAREYVFSSDAVREVAYANVLVKVRRFMHQVTAAWLEERLGERAPEFTEALAYHHFEGGAPVKAARYLGDAADRARAIHAGDDARLLLRRALQLLPPALDVAPALRAHLKEGLAALDLDRGDVDEAMSHLKVALSLSATVEGAAGALTRARLYQRIGEIHVHRSRQEAALGCFADAADQLEGLPLGDAAARATYAEIAKARGWALSRLGRREEARREFEAGLAQVGTDTEEERIIAARLMSALGLHARFQGIPQEALDHLGQALKLARRTSSLELRCVCLVNWGAVLFDLRLFDRARACYEEALEVQERIGREEDAAISRINLAQVALEEGEDGRAGRLAEDARGKLEAYGTHWALPELYRTLAQIHLVRGEAAPARALATLAITMGEQVENHYYVGGAHRLLGDLAVSEGDASAAHQHYARARERLEAAGEPRELAQVILAQARLSLSGGSAPHGEVAHDLDRAEALLTPYPNEPIRQEITRLRALLPEGG